MWWKLWICRLMRCRVECAVVVVDDPPISWSKPVLSTYVKDLESQRLVAKEMANSGWGARMLLVGYVLRLCRLALAN
ncbi:hypothetical protein HDK77DRAFT_2304 [Phyllosticta capitalensis]